MRRPRGYPPVSDKKPVVLVMSKSESEMRAIAKALGARCDTVFAGTGGDAILSLREAPDLVLFDTKFADLDCRGVCRRLAGADATETVSVIALIDRDDPAAEPRALSEGAADCIVKPIDPRVLTARVLTHLALKSHRDRIAQAHLVDGVTALPNREAGEQMLDAEWRRNARDKRWLAALIIEIDDFEPLTREYGGVEAEDCLRRVARCVRRTCHRAGDFVARFGDAQFIALLPRADDTGAESVAERLRRAVVDLGFPNVRSTVSTTATVSIGIAAMIPARGSRATALVELAKQRLAEATRAGKNRWVGAPSRPVIAPIASGSRAIRGNILIVDDTSINAEVLSGLLANTRCEVRVALSGAAALSAVRTECPDLVLLDISMPDIDGYEVCRRLKSDPATAEIPVIFISALDEPMDKVLAFDVGGADYIQKPFQPREVLARIEYQLEIGRLHTEMRAANTRLVELDNLKATITAMLVHDLRSPLTVVQMVLDSIQEETGAASAAELATTASASVTKIIGLVTDMLDIYRSDATGASFLLRPVDITPTLTRAVEFARVSSQHSQIQLMSSIEATLPLVMANEEKLDRALTNLLSNAIKFTPKGGRITLSARTVADPRDAGAPPRLRIEVTDTGCGIPAADLSHVFDPYRQAASNNQSKGVGLGLAIVKRIIDGHGGTIVVDSEVDRGTHFTIEVAGISQDASAELPAINLPASV
ncbi:MAG TPA: response regulator [Gemmatimonadaceae bacterium]|nr:response regulator [Gemmatimonadaceae bacterium]